MLGSDRHRIFQITLHVVTAVVLVVSFIHGQFPDEQSGQHVPTVVTLSVLFVVAWRRTFSDLSMLAFAGFILLHIVGARYIYSFVPYDEWTTMLFGVSVSDMFGFQRNHYDRFVHFAYGGLATAPQTEVLRRRLGLSLWWTHVISVSLVLCVGAMYEIFEWGLAETMAPDWADRYNGQQGDFWDAQKDMALNGLGAVLASVAMLVFGRPREA